MEDGSCSTATARVRLTNEPLQAVIEGGDRTVAAEDALSIDGCASEDPDDEDAQMTFAWTVEDSNGTHSSLDGTDLTQCELVLSQGSLDANENYVITLTVTAGDEVSEASISVTVLSGQVPEVTIVIEGDEKPSPTKKFVLLGLSPNIEVDNEVPIETIQGSSSIAATVGSASDVIQPSYRWAELHFGLDLADPAITTVHRLL